MAITATWTDPTTLDLTVGTRTSQAIWEGTVGNQLWLYDLLTGEIAGQPVTLADGLTVSAGASSVQALACTSLTVGGATPRSVTGGTWTSANPGVAANGGSIAVSVFLDDAITPSRIGLSLNISGGTGDVIAQVTGTGPGVVHVALLNFSGSTLTAPTTIGVVCY